MLRAPASPTTGARFTHLLVELATVQLREDGADPDDAIRHLLDTILDNTRRALVAILERHQDDDAIRHSIAGFWAYQLPGLDGFYRWTTEVR